MTAIAAARRGMRVAQLVERISEWLGRHINPQSAVLALTAGLLVALWVSLALYMSVEKRSALAVAERQSDNYARLLEEQTVRTVRVLDQTTVFVKTEYERLGKKFDLAGYARHGVFLDRFFNLIILAGPDGNVIAADRTLPPANIADREHFRVHVAEDSGKIFISKPVLGRSSGKWSVQFTRRLNKPDGSFGGIAVASLDPNYFSEFYKSLDTGKHSVAVLVGTDGIVRARRSDENNTVGQDISKSMLFERVKTADAGHYFWRSLVDGTPRLYSYRKLKDYPLIAMIGFAEDEVYAEYNDHIGVMKLMGAVASALILAVSLVLLILIRYQQRAQTALLASEREAVSASRMKSEFIARMAHELRTPLNGILGFSEYLQTSQESAENREFATNIHQAGQHLLSLVNTTLDLAKIESGRMDVAGKLEELGPLLQRVIGMQRSFAENKQLELKLELAPSLPEKLICDSTKLTQVLNNLVHNAIKFTGRGSVTLRGGSENGRILFAVTDTGQGLTAEQQTQLFQRFKQLGDKFETRAHGGSGLGLSLAKEMVELMGGRIWIESKPGAGSTFYFTLPIRRRIADRLGRESA
jgi:signal transduction histidine kinase